MRFGWLLAALIATTTAVALWADETAEIGSVAFILDCSRSMSEPAVERNAVRQVSSDETSRMEAARGLLEKMLQELATDGTHRVGVWLYGHRLVWEPDAKHPELLTQDAYLEASVGFAALNGLLPGDDVEQAQAFKRFTQQENRQLVVRLANLKAWGEKPLYLALTRALDALADQPATQPKTIIVLTDGGNEQWLARYKTDYDRISASLRNNLVPIHFVHFAPADGEEGQGERELRELAAQSGGSLIRTDAASELTVAGVIANSRKAASASVLTASDADDEEETDSQTEPRVARPAPRTITGSVVYYGKPVTSATIVLEGSDIPPVKADRQGRFLIRNVPAGGQYHLVVKAVARNHAREKAIDLKLDAEAEQQPFLSIDLK
jgi:hypothetical protein